MSSATITYIESYTYMGLDDTCPQLGSFDGVDTLTVADDQDYPNPNAWHWWTNFIFRIDYIGDAITDVDLKIDMENIVYDGSGIYWGVSFFEDWPSAYSLDDLDGTYGGIGPYEYIPYDSGDFGAMWVYEKLSRKPLGTKDAYTTYHPGYGTGTPHHGLFSLAENESKYLRLILGKWNFSDGQSRFKIYSISYNDITIDWAATGNILRIDGVNVPDGSVKKFCGVSIASIKKAVGVTK